MLPALYSAFAFVLRPHFTKGLYMETVWASGSCAFTWIYMTRPSFSTFCLYGFLVSMRAYSLCRSQPPDLAFSTKSLATLPPYRILPQRLLNPLKKILKTRTRVSQICRRVNREKTRCRTLFLAWSLHDRQMSYPGVRRPRDRLFHYCTLSWPHNDQIWLIPF